MRTLDWMSENKTPQLDDRSPWVIDTRELGRHAGLSRAVKRSVPVETPLGVPDVITIEAGSELELDLLLESVVEGVLVSGNAKATEKGACISAWLPASPLKNRIPWRLTCQEDVSPGGTCCVHPLNPFVLKDA